MTPIPSGAAPPRSVRRSALRGLSGRCPACGEGRLYGSFLAVRGHCPACGEALHHHRADDIAPLIAMFLSAHVVVPLAFLAALAASLPGWVNVAVFVTLGLALTLLALPSVKGAIVGVEWALRQHGFACETTRPPTQATSPKRARQPDA